jgi:excisionase family DNA binding protein
MRRRLARRTLLVPNLDEVVADPRRADTLPSELALELPLGAASRRLRRPAGRPRAVRTSGLPVQGSGSEPAPTAGTAPRLCASLPPRGLSVTDAATYVGVSVRDLWRRVERGELAVVRWPGCRRVVFDRQDLDALFSSAFKSSR